MGDPTLYGPAHSTLVSSARLALLAIDQSHQFVEPDLHRLDGARMTDMLPYFVSQAPSLLHNDLALYDTEAILLYIDSLAHDDGRTRLLPHVPRDRALMWQMVSVMRDYLQPSAIGGVVAQRLFVPHLGGRPDIQALNAAAVRMQDSLHLVEQISMLCHDGDRADYLIDDQPRLADLILMPIMHLLMQTNHGPAATANSVRLSRWWLAMQKLEKLQKGLPRLG
jgi:glutathione S-transferase